jgi:S1-C subfamily serine protease
MILAVILSCTIAAPVLADDDLKNAVVKIYTVTNRYDYYQPWQTLGQNWGSGSGCVIKGKRILTNAHVVANQTFIQVRRAGEAKKYTAEVEMVAHECDLAILKVRDASLFSNVKPIDIGTLPKIRDKVAVYGFPEGGDKLSITEGVVSRVEHRNYTHSKANLLTCQIDAAINSGNSGGPVIQENKVVGVAFQAMNGDDAENIGYMVPPPVIEHFLTDIEDSKYDGIPDLGISWQKMENPDLRKRYNMAEKQTGILVNTIYPESSAKDLLHIDDIIISIDGNLIENDGTIEFRKGERTVFDYVVQNKHLNDSVNIHVLRKGTLQKVSVTLSGSLTSSRLVSYEQYDVPPTYYIKAGLIFQPLTVNLLKLWGRKWYHNAAKNLLYYYKHGRPTQKRKELVVLVNVLADDINLGYHDVEDRVITQVNGKRISNMQDLINAFEQHDGDYHEIVDESGYRIVLDKHKVDLHEQHILKRYNVGSDRSADLRDTFYAKGT